MESSKEIRRRIKSVKNIGQITKAMELVAAAKMRKAQAQALASRPYAALSSSLLENLAKKVNPELHPLLGRVLPTNQSESEKVLVILVTADRGLAGALNTNIINESMKVIKEEGAEKVDFVTIGKKGLEAVRRTGHKVIAQFASKDRGLHIFDAKPVAEIAVDEFSGNHYGKVFIIYTHFVSTLTQKATMMQILPLVKSVEADKEEYLFEPSPDAVVENLIYHTIEFGIYQSMVEAIASEHSARMVAMRNANEAASELIDHLELSYNQARQAGITRELSEISAAKLAMEG